MTKKTFVGALVVGLAVAMTAGGLVASNMGFKLNYALSQADGGVTSFDGTNTIALPDNRQSGMADAKNLMDDITFANVTNVAKFLTANNGIQLYTGRKNGGTAFPLNSGEGYYVKMATSVNYIIVGSDNPTLAYTLRQADGGVNSFDGTNFFAYNYHQTAADAKQLMDDIGFASVTNVGNFLTANNGIQLYTGRKNGGTAFPLTPGRGYFVKMATTVNYTPSHY